MTNNEEVISRAVHKVPFAPKQFEQYIFDARSNLSHHSTTPFNEVYPEAIDDMVRLRYLILSCQNNLLTDTISVDDELALRDAGKITIQDIDNFIFRWTSKEKVGEWLLSVEGMPKASAAGITAHFFMSEPKRYEHIWTSAGISGGFISKANMFEWPENITVGNRKVEIKFYPRLKAQLMTAVRYISELHNEKTEYYEYFMFHYNRECSNGISVEHASARAARALAKLILAHAFSVYVVGRYNRVPNNLYVFTVNGTSVIEPTIPTNVDKVITPEEYAELVAKTNNVKSKLLNMNYSKGE